MSKIRRHLRVITDVLLIAIAFGGLLFACSNQESTRQADVQDSAMLNRAIYQPPLGQYLTIDDLQWQKMVSTPGYFNNGVNGVLLDVRYWEETTDIFIGEILQAGYNVDYVDSINQRMFVWVESAEQLVSLSKIQGVSAISISRLAPKMNTALKVFDERRK
ncbi:Uncharacterised protein [Zhongshania aliphaticivorans]|uniref:Uncharacterized protein n=1 Tax=Zhongshania aliphaticivorans TaxID=1470434 RepID=A0A5S9NDP1_9GAMM|nr:hypothetical protein [Zhongshania aliphaticivorans]CAA0088454.1 Uncharacterised protein [Zhongshania aliphaticivorans]CAA0120536.1 Uncharacterised protein [Zhongshania aliphaticivorans]